MVPRPADSERPHQSGRHGPDAGDRRSRPSARRGARVLRGQRRGRRLRRWRRSSAPARRRPHVLSVIRATSMAGLTAGLSLPARQARRLRRLPRIICNTALIALRAPRIAECKIGRTALHDAIATLRARDASMSNRAGCGSSPPLASRQSAVTNSHRFFRVAVAHLISSTWRPAMERSPSRQSRRAGLLTTTSRKTT
ncbi:hypothetical protein BLAT2472_40297 [Burkholderia latens]